MIASKCGMVLVNVHQAYIDFDRHGERNEIFAVRYFLDLLHNAKYQLNNLYGNALFKGGAVSISRKFYQPEFSVEPSQ